MTWNKGNGIPLDGSTVVWHWPGHPASPLPPAPTTFHNNGTDGRGTVKWFADRYANGNLPVLPDGSYVRAQLGVEIEDLGPLGAAMMRAALDPNNKWGLTVDQAKNDLVIRDFGATECPDGIANAEIVKLYPVSGQVGDWPPGSLDPNNPKHGKWLLPYGAFTRTVNGVPNYYFNDRREPKRPAV